MRRNTKMNSLFASMAGQQNAEMGAGAHNEWLHNEWLNKRIRSCLAACGPDMELSDVKHGAAQLVELLRLIEISPPSSKSPLAVLSELQTLILKYCCSLTRLPETLELMTKLKELSIRNCWSLTGLPESLGRLAKLRKIELHHCLELRRLPESLGDLLRLETLDLNSCIKLTGLPESLGCLLALKYLDLFNCNELARLPESVGQLAELHKLDLRECRALTCLPESMGQLAKLRMLNLQDCRSLTHLPESVGQLRLATITTSLVPPGHAPSNEGFTGWICNGKWMWMHSRGEMLQRMMTLVLAARRRRSQQTLQHIPDEVYYQCIFLHVLQLTRLETTFLSCCS